MRKLAWHNSFRRAFKHVVHKNPAMKDRIFQVLTLLSENPFDTRLKTHKLRGQLVRIMGL